MHTYRPPRLDDLLHVSIGDGDEASTLVQSVADDGKTLTLTGPSPRGDVRVVIRRVDRYLTKLET